MSERPVLQQARQARMLQTPVEFGAITPALTPMAKPKASQPSPQRPKLVVPPSLKVIENKKLGPFDRRKAKVAHQPSRTPRRRACDRALLNVPEAPVAGPNQPKPRGITRQLEAIDGWIREPQNERRLRRSLARWNQLESALQALKQTHQAIDAFHSNDESSDGERLLMIYGLLQALVLQQDALCHLGEALRTKPLHLERHRRLCEIRNIRNWSVGHPTKVDRGPALSHHAIARPKIGRGGFSLHSAFEDGRFQYMYVPLPQLARLQRRLVSMFLRDIFGQVRAGVPFQPRRKALALSTSSVRRPYTRRRIPTSMVQFRGEKGGVSAAA